MDTNLLIRALAIGDEGEVEVTASEDRLAQQGSVDNPRPKDDPERGELSAHQFALPARRLGDGRCRASLERRPVPV